jgi:hypothetical protein
MKKNTIYGLFLGLLALFGVATLTPALALESPDFVQNPAGFGQGESIKDELGNNASDAGGGLITVIKNAINWVL